MVGLSTEALIRMIDSGALKNSPVTREHVKIAQYIWGTSAAFLMGKTTRCQPDAVEIIAENITPIPREILDNHKDITICIDIMKINKIPFLTTYGKVIQFGAITELKSGEMPVVLSELRVVITKYQARGFTILAIACDNGFKALETNEEFLTLGIALNITAEDEHEPHIERFNRTIKERCRMVLAMTPFTKIPRRMVIELVYGQTFWYNFTIPEDYISKTYGPGTLILGRTYDYTKLCGTGSSYGEYVQTHEKIDSTMKPRTVSAICLRPSGNQQGSFYYYSLNTGRRLHRRKATTLPMPQEIIDRVHHIANLQNAPDGIAFTKKDGTPYFTDEDDDSIQDNEHAAEDDGDNNSDNSSQNSEGTETTGVVDAAETAGMDVDNETTGVHGNINNIDHQEIDEVDTEEDEPNVPLHEMDNVINLEDDPEPTDPVNELIEPNDEEPSDIPIQRTTRSGRVSKPHVWKGFEGKENYSFTTTKDNAIKGSTVTGYLCAQTAYINSLKTYSEVSRAPTHAIEHLVLTQVGMQQGIKLWGERGVKAILKEMKQFHERNVVRPLRKEEISDEVRKRALGYLMFLKEKRNGDIKGRGCADGRKQRLYKSKYETASPTAFIESIFITALIDAQEKRDVAHVDIPGAFLQIDASDGTIIKLQGSIVHIMLKIDPTWKQHVVYEGRKRVPTIYSEAIKALYGTVDAAKLFHDNLIDLLTNKLGFKQNAYDPCVVNKDINGKQATIVFYVDDLKISHAEPKVGTSIIHELDKAYGDIMPLSISRGKIHDYLGMVFDYSIEGQVKITMYQYIKGIIDNAPDIYKNGVAKATPAPTHLYDIRDPEQAEVQLLDKKEKEEYHTLTAQCLYLSKRGRPDIQQAVAFHCTRVNNPDRDDQKKLARLIRYLMSTIYLPLILSMNNNGVSEWWVDASFAIHNDMRSRTGATMSLGRGSIYCASTKQKIMASSSTEAELVGVSDTLLKILWCRHFMEEQGCAVEDVYVYQDNQSAMLLENNGMRSVGKGSRHIRIKYFFVTDKIKDKEMKVIYCPTEDMLSDFYTKPLQGALFFKHRNKIMGIDQDEFVIYQKQYNEYLKTIVT